MELKKEFADGAKDLVSAAWKYSAIIQQYDTMLKGAQDEIGRMQCEQAKGVDAMVEGLELEKASLEKKVGVLNSEILKTAGLQDEVVKLRAQVLELEEKSRRDAENTAAEASRLRQSRQKWAESVATQVYDSMQEWYAPRLARLGAFVVQHEAVKKAIVKIAIDEAPLDYVRKRKGVSQDLDALIGKLEAKVEESKAAEDKIDEVEISADDYVAPHRLDLRFCLAEFCFDNVWVSPRGFDQFGRLYHTIRPNLAELMIGGSPTRRSSGAANADAGMGAGLDASETKAA